MAFIVLPSSSADCRPGLFPVPFWCLCLLFCFWSLSLGVSSFMALLLILPKSQLFNSLIFSIYSISVVFFFFFLRSVIFFCLLWVYFALFLGCWGGPLSLLTWDFSSFLMQTFNAINFPFHTTFTVPFKFWYVWWIIQKYLV